MVGDEYRVTMGGWTVETDKKKVSDDERTKKEKQRGTLIDRGNVG